MRSPEGRVLVFGSLLPLLKRHSGLEGSGRSAVIAYDVYLIDDLGCFAMKLTLPKDRPEPRPD
jgi:hypothetical protein